MNWKVSFDPAGIEDIKQASTQGLRNVRYPDTNRRDIQANGTNKAEFETIDAWMEGCTINKCPDRKDIHSLGKPLILG